MIVQGDNNQVYLYAEPPSILFNGMIYICNMTTYVFFADAKLMLFSQTSKHFFGFLVYFFFMATMGKSVIDMSGEWFGDWGRGREWAAGGWGNR